MEEARQELSPVMHIKLRVHVPEVGFDGVVADDQRRRDLRIAQSAEQACQDVSLLTRQRPGGREHGGCGGFRG